MPLLESISAELLLVGRLLFGAVLAFTGVGHFTDREQMVGYAEANGVPAAGVLVPLTGAMLILGGLGVAAGVFPVVAAGVLAAFFVVTTPVMHDFWAREGEERQNQLVQFQKNAALFGAALTFIAIGGRAWEYAVGVGVFV